MNQYLPALFFLFCLLNSPKLASQTSIIRQYHLQQYTDENGLPQNSVKSIAADGQGYIWLATENGLVRFDGQQFYNFNDANLGIITNRFALIQPSLKGLQGNRRALYAIADQYQYVRITDGKAVKDSLYGSTLQKLPHFKKGSGATQLSLGLPSFLNRGANPSYYIIPIPNIAGSFYVCDRLGATLYRGWKITSRIHFKNDSFWNFFTIGDGLYYFAANGKIALLGPKSVSWHSLGGHILKADGYPVPRQQIQIYWNPTNDQVFLYVNTNLYILSPLPTGDISTRLLLKNFNLESRNIQSIYYDSALQTLFLGSLTEGLYVLQNQSFHPVTAVSGKAEDNIFYAQTRYGQNQVLTPSGIVAGLDSSSLQSTGTRIPAIYSAVSGDTRSLLTDRQGCIWIKAGHALRKFTANGHQLLMEWNLGNEIKTLYMDPEGIIWLGLNANGLYRLDPAVPKPQPRLFSKHILRDFSYIITKQPGKLLLGTEHGLYEADIRTGEISLVKATDGLFIKSIYVANPNQVWLTVVNKGIYLYNGDQLTLFPPDENKYLHRAHCMVEDRNGYFWVPTNNGLFKINKDDLLKYVQHGRRIKSRGNSGDVDRDASLFYQYFDKKSGFLINEFNGGCQPCALRLSNGYLSLPSLKGLVWFVPESVSPATPSKALMLDRVEYDRQSLINVGDTVHLPVDAQRIRFTFSTPFFGHPSNLIVSYKLVGHNQRASDIEWVPMSSKDLTILYSSLSSGKYVLYSKKINGFGADNQTIKKIYIAVPMQWYETWWARMLATMLLIACTYAYMSYRLQKVRRENRRLEDKIARRTHALNESKKQQGKQLQVMSRLLTSMSHDIQSPLNFITRTTGSMSRIIQQGDLDEIALVVGLINKSSKNMGTLVADLLDYIKTYVYGKSLKFEMINVSALVDKKLSIFRNVIDANGNRVEKIIPSDFFVASDYQMISIVFNNLIDNAAKYTKDGTITIRAWEGEAAMHFVISNTGQPLPDDVLSMFNQKHTVPFDDVPETFKGGLGSFLIREITDLLNVQLKVTQTESTNFELVFRQDLT